MGEVDPAYIQSLEHRPKPVIHEAEEIPTIDLASIISLDHVTNNDITDQQIANLVTKIGEACEKWGFFEVINHGVPMEKLEQVETESKKFFTLPLEEKKKVKRDEGNPMGYHDSEHTKNVRDWKEIFDYAAQDPIVFLLSPDDPKPMSYTSRWPTNPSNLRGVAQDYAKEIEKLGFKLLELIALSLGLPAARFNSYFEESMSFIRLNYYPPCDAPHLALGAGRHKDPGAITILAQDSVGGLQVRRKSDGEWVKVKPNPGAFIINIGDTIQVWSNDKYESVDHRVMVNSEKERVSVPYFFHPAYYVMLKPLEELINEENKAKYKEFNWGEFYAARKQGNYKKLKVDNLQISHFKITE